MAASEGGLAELVRDHGRNRPDVVALVYGTEEITWRELDERSNLVSSALVAHGLEAGDRVAFLGKNAPEYFDVLFGAAKLGVVTVAVNWRLNPTEIAFIVNDAEAAIVFVGSEFSAVAAELGGSLAAAKTVIVYGSPQSDGPTGGIDYEDWLDGHVARDPGHQHRPGEVALQLYTSGTTGLPKGAMLTNANMALLSDNAGTMFGLDEHSVNLVALPVFHIGGAGYALVGMAHGCQTVLMRDFDPEAVLEAVPGRHVTNAFLVPVMLAALAAVPGVGDGDYSSLRSIIYGASPITEEALKLVMGTFGCAFVQVYGMTETTGAITKLDAENHDPDGPRSHLLRSAGRPFEWVEIRIVDPDTGDVRPVGVVGELWTRSGQNMLGYWNNLDATSRTITADGWLRTGDAGYVDEEGYIFLTDRIKDMIVTGGENVYPIEVENVLAAHEAVADVAVIGVPDAKWGETVKAVVVLRKGAKPDPAAIIAFARERIAHFKCPSSVDFVEVLPRNPSGKILKRELREPFWEGHERRIS